MIQTWRFPLILALSVVFGMPALHGLVADPDGLLQHGFTYLGALGLSWLGVNAVFRLVQHYDDANQRMIAAERAAAEAALREAEEAAALRDAVDAPIADPSGAGAPAGRPGAPNVGDLAMDSAAA